MLKLVSQVWFLYEVLLVESADRVSDVFEWLRLGQRRALLTAFFRILKTLKLMRNGVRQAYCRRNHDSILDQLNITIHVIDEVMNEVNCNSLRVDPLVFC